jgi:hypothetical protein
VVVFDAWRYEGDELRRQFLREVAAELERVGELANTWTDKHLEELDTTSTGDEPERLLAVSRQESVRLLVQVGFAAVLIWLAWKYGPSFGKGAKREAERIISAVLIAVATFLIGGLSRVLYVPTRTVTTGELKPELFSAKFSQMIADLKKSNRLVVVIDNLDRCSASRIEQIFFTLSTFLEPLSVERNTKRIPIGKDRSKKDAVFVIAADDQALRTHLNAQEAAASGGTQPIGRRDDVGSYADEYLRKIFKASIAMKQILADDMRGYVGNELAGFCKVRSLTAEDRATVVQLVSAALKYNPRRIKEFGNNLELMLRVIEARESGSEPQIAPKISSDVLLVAKVRLIEEEWPERYAELYRNPRLLTQWYEQIAAYGEIQGGSEQRFNAFMNVARSIPDKNLRALLRLKQSWEEVRLPRYVEFHEALVEGQAELVNEIVTAEGADTKAYAARLTPILTEEVDRLYTAGARNLIEVALTLEALRNEQAEIKRLMIAAADSRALRLDLRNSPAQLILGASTLLDDIRFNQLIEPWVELDSFYSDSPERAVQVVEALAPHLSRLSAERSERLSKGLAEEPLRASISTYLPLVEAEPALTPLSLGKYAVGLLKHTFDTSSDAFRLIRAWLLRPTVAEEPQDELADLISAELLNNTATDGTFSFSEEQLHTLADVIANLNELAEPDTLQTACLGALPAALAADLGDSLLDLLDAALAWDTAVAQQTAGQAVVLYAAHDLDALMNWAESREGINETLALVVARKMREVVLDATCDRDIRLRAAAIISSLDPEDHEELVSSSPYQLITAGDWAMARTLVDEYPVGLYERDNADSAIKRAHEESPGISAEAFDFIERVIKTFKPDDLDKLRDFLDGAVTDGDAEQARRAMEGADRFAKRDRRFRSRRDSLLRELFDSIAQTEAPPPELARLLAERATSLDRDRRNSFISQLERWIKQPGAHQADIASVAIALEDPETSERGALIDALVNAETAAVGNPALRRRLLESAEALRGWRTSNASKRLRARLKAIKTEGGEENEQLLKELDFD